MTSGELAFEKSDGDTAISFAVRNGKVFSRNESRHSTFITGRCFHPSSTHHSPLTTASMDRWQQVDKLLEEALEQAA